MLIFHHQLCPDLIFSSLSSMKRTTMKISISLNISWTCTDLKKVLSILNSEWNKFKLTSSSAEPLLLNLLRKVPKFWKKNTNSLDKGKKLKITELHTRWLFVNLNHSFGYLRPLPELTVMIKLDQTMLEKCAVFWETATSTSLRMILNLRLFKMKSTRNFKRKEE